MADDKSQPQEEKKISVIVDQDGEFLRLEQGEVELEEGKDFDLYEEEVEKEEDDEVAEDAGTPPAKAESTELEHGDEVVFTEAVAALLKSKTGIFLEAISSVEASIQVEDREEVVGFDSFKKAE